MKKSLILLNLLTVFSINIFAQKVEKLILLENEIPNEYKIVESNKCKSIQSTLLFKNPEMYEMLYGKIVSKKIQNFENSKDSGSVLYLEFEKKFESESFIKGLIWGGSKNPTEKNPEEIMVKNNILVIWSFNKISKLKEISKKKIELEIK